VLAPRLVSGRVDNRPSAAG